MALCSSPGVAEADTATIGTFFAHVSLRSSFTTVQPSSFGSWRSSRMSCGRCSRASSRAANPSVATVASWPACLTIRSASSRLFGSSSTTRILAIPTALPSGLVGGEREIQGERGPEPQPDTARGDGAAQRLDDQARDVEAEADADLVLRPRGLDASVLAEDHAKMRARKDDALILHDHPRVILALSHGHVDRRARRREAKRVVQDVFDRRA